MVRPTVSEPLPPLVYTAVGAVVLGLVAGGYSLDRVFGDATPINVGLLAPFIAGTLVLLAGRPSGQRDAGPVSQIKSGSLLVGIFVAYLCLTALWSPDLEVSLAQLLQMASVPYYIWLVAALTRRWGINVLWGVVWWVAAIGGLFAFIGLVTWDGGRLAILGGGPNVYSRTTAYAVVACLALLQTFSLTKFARLVMFLTALAASAATMASGSRGAVAGLVGGVAIWLMLLRRRRWNVVVAAAAVVALLFLALRSGDSAFADIWQGRFVDLTVDQLYLAGRETYWEVAWQLVGANPLFGSGLGAFAYYFGIPGVYPHNFVLDVLIAGGLVFLGITVAVMLRLIVPGIRAGWRGDLLSSTFLSLASINLIASQASGTFYDTRFMWVFLACAYMASQFAVANSTTSDIADTCTPAGKLARSKIG